MSKSVGLYQTREVHKGFSVRARYLIFVIAMCIACFLLPCPAGQAEEGTRGCWKPFIRSILPGAGQPGDLVTIRGQRFGTAWGDVIFSTEVKAEIVNWAFTLIRVRVPESASTGPVFVRVYCGAESNKRDFTVNE
jgi:hypothetical protein